MPRKEEKRRMSICTSPRDNDAKSLLKKLTPKLIKSSVDLSNRQDEDNGPPKPGKSTEESAPTSDGHGTVAADVPDWYEELSDDHVSAFKEVFDMLDASQTGTLNADSLFEGLRRVDSEITRGEVEDVLKTLDKDGNGEIDFDEFLFHISHSDAMESGADDDENFRKRRSAFTKRQRLFYSAITEFSLKRTLVEIHRAQMARVNQPHVLSHYTAGARLIGLTDRQLANEMKRMHKNMKQQDSPYAKPLALVVSAGARKTVRKAIRPRLKAGERAAQSEVQQSGAGQVTGQMSQMKQISVQVPVATTHVCPTAVPIPEIRIIPEGTQMSGWTGVFSKIRPELPQQENTNIKDTMRMLASRGSIVAKLPDSHKILELREKLAKGMVVAVAEEAESPPLSPEPQAATPPPTTPPPSPSAAPDKPKKPRLRGRRTITGWIIPRVDRDKVPLPVLKMKYKHHRPTIEDLPNIREKVSQAIDDYYESLRQATVKCAWDHWDKLYSHHIRSHKLMENFREVYRAYSPHKAEEAFVVCPWVPGPFRHIKHSIRCHTAGYYKPDYRDRHRPVSRQNAAPSRTDHRQTSGRTSRTENRPVSAM